MSVPALDKLGATASIACAAHCALMPVLIAALPFLGAGLLADERMEWALVVSSAALGLLSLGMGFRQHRRRAPLAVLSAGLTLLVLGRTAEGLGGETVGVGLAAAGGLTVALAHLLNHRCACVCHRGTDA